LKATKTEIKKNRDTKFDSKRATEQNKEKEGERMKSERDCAKSEKQTSKRESACVRLRVCGRRKQELENKIKWQKELYFSLSD